MGVGDRSDPTRLVPPYAMTGGRARPLLGSGELELETLVSSTELGERSMAILTPEQQRIVVLCRGVLSVAEVSAHLDVPVGVARVLVGDMAAERMLVLRRPDAAGSRADRALLERVLSRLRAL